MLRQARTQVAGHHSHVRTHASRATTSKRSGACPKSQTTVHAGALLLSLAPPFPASAVAH
jgi:hypothetical protein